MSIPLSFIHSLPAPDSETSLGDFLSYHISDQLLTFLDCFPNTHTPALLSPDSNRPPLHHDALRSFVAQFALPLPLPSSSSSANRRPFGLNDRIMVALPTTPESALALLALSCYHTVCPVNTTCTASELADDARRLGVRAVLSTRDAVERLDLRGLQRKLGCEVIFLCARERGPVGLFDLYSMDAIGTDSTVDLNPSEPCGLDDQTLVLQTSGTSGKKKVVPYPLRNLIVGTCAVIKSWGLREDDVNSMYYVLLLAFDEPAVTRIERFITAL